MDSLYKEVMTFRETLKLYHFQCKSFPEHKISDEILIKFDDTLDKFFEMYQGAEGRIKIKKLTLSISGQLTKNEIIIIAVTLQKTLKNQNLKFDLANVRDELVGIMNLFIYLLSFN